MEADCENLSKLPNGTANLMSLKILDAPLKLICTIEGIGRMTSLEKLKEFKVDKTNNWGIEELKRLNTLRGSLTISSLENVVGESEARRANLDQKVYLERLTLEWNTRSTCDEKAAEEVLEALSPSGAHLKYLAIKGYKGRGFPSWLLHGSHLPNLKEIELISWANCTDIPIKYPPSLLHLRIQDFPELSTLMLHNIPTSLKNLYIDGFGIEDDLVKACLCYFDSLQELSVKNCPELSEPLEKEVVVGCMERSLRKLEVGGGNWGFYFSLERDDDAVWKLDINELESSLQEAASARRWAWRLLLAISPQVRRMIITDSDIESTGADFKELFLVINTVNYLLIRRCKEMLSLPMYIAELATLHQLRLHGCPKMQSIPDASLPVSLTRLFFTSCESLASLPCDMRRLTALKWLVLYKCPKMRSMFDVSLPASLELLSISDCENLSSLPCDMMGMASLRELQLYDCANIASFPASGLPDSLHRLEIIRCRSLEERYRRESGGPDWQFASRIPDIVWE